MFYNTNISYLTPEYEVYTLIQTDGGRLKGILPFLNSFLNSDASIFETLLCIPLIVCKICVNFIIIFP